jgi:RNA polymerase sigma-70 factor (ECF subfamily)
VELPHNNPSTRPLPSSTRTDDADTVLIKRAQAGQRDAFNELVRAHQDRVYLVVRGVIRNPDDAADVVQETFISVLKSIGQFQGNAKFTTWLHRIAIRKAYDQLRKRVPDPVDPTERGVTGISSTTDPHQQRLTHTDIHECINALDPPFRDAILLVDVAGVSVDEAATILEVAPGTIKSRVFRGRASLASALGTRGY